MLILLAVLTARVAVVESNLGGPSASAPDVDFDAVGAGAAHVEKVALGYEVALSATAVPGACRASRMGRGEARSVGGAIPSR